MPDPITSYQVMQQINPLRVDGGAAIEALDAVVTWTVKEQS